MFLVSGSKTNCWYQDTFLLKTRGLQKIKGKYKLCQVSFPLQKMPASIHNTILTLFYLLLFTHNLYGVYYVRK